MSESDRPSELDSTEILPNSHQTRRIGPYRLLERIGEGGMGEVYVAEQIEPIRRKVALKIIKYGMNTEEVVRRFESERQALAMMDHPCIAKVFDAGATERGRLFFVMEYVEGVPITKHCDTHRLTTTERLVLFQQVCKGVQHAHQKAIIHRDLKPSNVLVTIQNGKAVPKIIDFGVAKAIAQKLTERTLHTQLGQIIGTPEYMSPEQAEMTGQNVDTRTDVYSLGVLLYELLVGTLPFNPRELRKAGFDEIRRKIREDDPLRPSTRITKMGKTSITAAQNRRTNPTKLSSLLRGDLDWITMCALEKDRTRRYGSPADLASDITRYLDNRPVMASPPSVLYRLRKFVKRHNLAVGVAVALMLVLIVFAATMAVQAGRIARERDRALAAEQQARTEANIAEEVSEFLVDLFAVSDPSEARGNNITAREILDRGVARVTETLKDQPDIQARLMETMGSSYTNLALYDQALDLLQDVNLYHRSQHEGDHPDVANSLLLLVSVQIARGEYKQAEEMARQALSMNRRVLGEDHDQTAESLHLLAICFKEQGRFEEAEEAYRQALAIRRRVLGNEHVRTASTLTSLGELLRVKSNFEEAKAMQREALAVAQRAVGDIHPVVRTCIANLALVLQDMEAYDEVEEMQREVLHQDRQLFGIRSPQYATSLSNLAAQLKL